MFDSYGPFIRGLDRKPRAAMVSMSQGQITAYALDALQTRGRLFVAPGHQTWGPGTALARLPTRWLGGGGQPTGGYILMCACVYTFIGIGSVCLFCCLTAHAESA